MKVRKPRPTGQVALVQKRGEIHVTIRRAPVPANAGHEFHTSPVFMDYLHGDVNVEEAEVACLYEYARESEMLWAAAQERDGLKAARALDCRRAAREVAAQHPKEWYSHAPWAMSLLLCESFPEKDWCALPPNERSWLNRTFGAKPAAALPMTDLLTLKGLGVLDKLQAMAADAEPDIEEVPPGKTGKPVRLVFPLVQRQGDGSLYHALFDIDFSKSETQLVNEFRAWVRLPENRDRLATHKAPRSEAAGQALDRLKELAVWRLYRELGDDWNAANDFANKHRKSFATRSEIQSRYNTKEKRKRFTPKSPKPFRDAKRQQGKPPAEADLLGEDADARKAVAGAKRFLTRIIPQEFGGPPTPRMAALLERLQQNAVKP
jgi:hypothetical protein